LLGTVADERARHLAAAPTDLGGEAKRALLDGVSDALGEACVPKVNQKRPCRMMVGSSDHETRNWRPTGRESPGE
jgi:hypothetical protein